MADAAFDGEQQLAQTGGIHTDVSPVRFKHLLVVGARDAIGLIFVQMPIEALVGILDQIFDRLSARDVDSIHHEPVDAQSHVRDIVERDRDQFEVRNRMGLESFDSLK